MADSISVHCADETMGECTPDECDQYRVWLQGQLETLYPGVEVDISSEDSHYGPFYHIDNGGAALDEKMIGIELELTEGLDRLVQDLWDNCNWEFLAEKENA